MHRFADGLVGRNENGAKRPLVLVVDDDPDLRLLAHMQLSPHGYEVIQASDGKRCLELATARSPDVILLDMMMPGMNGSEVLMELSKNPATQDIPVIFISARASTEDRVAGLQQGAVDWIPKPADPRELVARVGAAARTRARNQEIKVQAGADPVTRLEGRAAFEKRLRKEISRVSRSSSTLSILLVEIDRAEELQQKHGAHVIDALMRELASVLRQGLRVSDELFRYAAFEFAALLPDTELPTAFTASERCRDEIATVEVAKVPTSASVGVAQYSPGHTADEVIAKAEIALFHAKESGGGRSWRADDPRKHGVNPIALSEELTDREWDVLVHLSHGRTEHEIARRLGITRGTVRSHKARIRRKLQVPHDARLSDFVRSNFKELIRRLPAR